MVGGSPSELCYQPRLRTLAQAAELRGRSAVRSRQLGSDPLLFLRFHTDLSQKLGATLAPWRLRLVQRTSRGHER